MDAVAEASYKETAGEGETCVAVRKNDGDYAKKKHARAVEPGRRSRRDSAARTKGGGNNE